MSIITLNRGQARYFVDVALSAASTDGILPVICGAHITGNDNRLRVTCTDRYRAHTAFVDALSISGDVDFIIPRTALLWLKRNITFFGSYRRDLNRIVIDVTPHSEVEALSGFGDLLVTVKEDESAEAATVQWKGKHVKGNFPPVITLIEQARSADHTLTTPTIRLDQLGKASALNLGDHPQIKFTETSSTGKPGAVYLAWGGSTPRAEALIQPIAATS